ncbi:SDR family oxidoreductase [Phanerochaete sordida]|uniref:SDR family oxidoreductase n=1 Tax=Phanerochaete sordida TaxID=48140 RepID=A0A9P3GJ35_9APHY|nr:SDR family oxidoreductase [Phanerochaete sordida]
MPSYVVTGASRGIGLQFVRQLSADPSNTVFGLVRNKGTSQRLLALAHARSNVHVLEADVTDAARLRAAAAEVAKLTDGTLDCLVNNAAYVQETRRAYDLTTYSEKDEDDLLAADFDAAFRVNVLGVAYATNAFLPPLRAAASPFTSTTSASTAANPAKVITLSSGIGDVDLTRALRFAGQAAYCASKAAVNMLVAKYAARFAEEPLVFLALSPGLVDTSTRAPTPEELEFAVEFIERGKEVYPEWDGRPISPEVSVRAMLEVIGKVGREDSGAFVSHWGNKQWV